MTTTNAQPTDSIVQENNKQIEHILLDKKILKKSVENT